VRFPKILYSLLFLGGLFVAYSVGFSLFTAFSLPVVCKNFVVV